MSRLLLRPTPLHRMASRPTSGGGIRWSSYVGDLRCQANLSKSYFSTANISADYFNFAGDSGRGASPSVGGDRRLSTTSNNSNNNNHKHSIPRSAPHERLLVLGSGVAGCAAALTAARHGVPVTVLHAGSTKEDCNSYWAQGGVIYRNYRLREEEEGGGGESKLVDTPLSLVNDIRVASGYQSPLQRTQSLEEGAYSSDLIQNRHNQSSKMGRRCPTSGVHWNEDAAWKLACEGPSRIRELLLGAKDDGLGDALGCVVPFDRTTLPTGSEDDDNDSLGERDGTEDDVLSLCLEASHAAPRIIHHADCTGKAITVSITKAASEHPLIEFVGDRVATDLIFDEEGHGGQSGIDGASEHGMVIGAKVLDKRTNRPTDMYAVHGVVLASGGLAGIYQHSTNPLGFNALGSSVGLALRLEDRLSSGTHMSGIASDLEYVQFHPTALCLPGEARFLLTEALRGEGAVLRDASGRAFARDYHPNGELAPRDIVARAVFSESQKAAVDGAHNAYLDISHRDSRWLVDRFPSIHAHLSSRDTPMDFTKEKIPVIPAAHYTCGGVTTDLNGCVVSAGGGSYGNLYAAGEAARTGLHGGNRLASTSLLEGLVFGASVGEVVAGVAGGDDDELAREGRERATEAMHRARHVIEHRLVMEQRGSSSSPANGLNGHGGLNGNSADERVAREAEALLAHLKALMWDNVGVVRTPSKLAEAVSELTALRDEADGLWRKEGAGWEAAALRDAAHAGRAVAEAALANRTSGGAHCVVLDENDEGAVDRGKEHDSDDEDDDGLVVARA